MSREQVNVPADEWQNWHVSKHRELRLRQRTRTPPGKRVMSDEHLELLLSHDHLGTTQLEHLNRPPRLENLT